MLFTNKFIFDNKPYDWIREDLYRLEYECGAMDYPCRKLTQKVINNKPGYVLSGAFFTNEEIINLANKKQHEYKERFSYPRTSNAKMVGK